MTGRNARSTTWRSDPRPHLNSKIRRTALKLLPVVHRRQVPDRPARPRWKCLPSHRTPSRAWNEGCQRAWPCVYCLELRHNLQTCTGRFLGQGQPVLRYRLPGSAVRRGPENGKRQNTAA